MFGIVVGGLYKDVASWGGPGFESPGLQIFFDKTILAKIGVPRGIP
jgi:hypothetical protein